MLKFYVRQGKIVDLVHEIFPYKQSKWEEKNKAFIHKKEVKQREISKKKF